MSIEELIEELEALRQGRLVATHRTKDLTAARLAEEIVGHPLPGAVMRGGTLARLRAARA